MDKLKEKLKMGQKKSKQAAKSQENLENTNNSAKNNFDNDGSYSPPRGMKDILNSETKTSQFRTFLNTIDQENENNVEVLRLDFVLACRKMGQLLSGSSHSNPLVSSTNRANAVTVTRVSVGASVSSTSGPVSIDVAAVKVSLVLIRYIIYFNQDILSLYFMCIINLYLISDFSNRNVR